MTDRRQSRYQQTLDPKAVAGILPKIEKNGSHVAHLHHGSGDDSASLLRSSRMR
jgi:hypothetical protein